MADGRLQPAPDKLGSDQRTFLLYGPDDRCGDAFNTEAEVEAAWQRYREALLACCPPGRRPWGWRIFDELGARVPWKGYDRERSGLWRAGVLSLEETATVERQWRLDFVRAQNLDEARKRAHFAWADIPRELVRRWKQSKKEPSNAIAEGQSA